MPARHLFALLIDMPKIRLAASDWDTLSRSHPVRIPPASISQGSPLISQADAIRQKSHSWRD